MRAQAVGQRHITEAQSTEHTRGTAKEEHVRGRAVGWAAEGEAECWERRSMALALALVVDRSWGCWCGVGGSWTGDGVAVAQRAATTWAGTGGAVGAWPEGRWVEGSSSSSKSKRVRWHVDSVSGCGRWWMIGPGSSQAGGQPLECSVDAAT
jgi:hypothetical protein